MHAIAVLQQPPLCGKRAEESWQRKSGEDLGQSQPTPTFLSTVSASEFSKGGTFCGSFGWESRLLGGTVGNAAMGGGEPGERDESLGRGWSDRQQCKRKG